MPRKSWREALATYANPATLALLLLGFAAGLPYMLVFSTLSVWLREAGVDTVVLGCTHYPLLLPWLRTALPEVMHWVESGEAIARLRPLGPGARCQGVTRVQLGEGSGENQLARSDLGEPRGLLFGRAESREGKRSEDQRRVDGDRRHVPTDLLAEQAEGKEAQIHPAELLWNRYTE